VRLGRVMDGEKVIGYRFMKDVVPMNGWDSDYKYMETKKERVLMNTSRALLIIALVWFLILAVKLIIVVL
jgi:hypothetical protein